MTKLTSCRNSNTGVPLGVSSVSDVYHCVPLTLPGETTASALLALRFSLGVLFLFL